MLQLSKEDVMRFAIYAQDYAFVHLFGVELGNLDAARYGIGLAG